MTYLEDELPGPSYNVSFDRLAGAGFGTEWTHREEVRDIADAFRAGE